MSFGRHAPDDPPPLKPSEDLVTVDTETRHYRHDGWTSAARADFVEMLAKSGVVTDACREVQRSSQAAYAPRNRDALFAAGWDAALSMPRARLADDLFHRAVNGTVDQIWKDGEVVAERHRHDNRLSIAVLTRLDARCDRAERIGAPTLRIAAEWDDYLAALAGDRLADARALLDPPPPAPPLQARLGEGGESALLHQLHQLRDGRALDEVPGHEEDCGDEDEEQRIWIADFAWRTNFPPPDDFDGDEDGDYGDDEYSRECTPDEATLLDRRYPDAFTNDEAATFEQDEAARSSFFAALAEDVAEVEEVEDVAPSCPLAAPAGSIDGSAEEQALSPAVRQDLDDGAAADQSAACAPDSS